MAKLTVADLEVLFTANTQQVDKADKQIVAIGKKVESNPIKVDADAKGALASMDRVETEAKKLVSERAVLKLDADITRAENNLKRAVDRLEDLHIRAEGGLDVTADVKRAEANIQRVERQLDGLRRARNVIDVEADTSGAEDALAGVSEDAGEAGADSGEEFGKSIVAALASIPIAGAVIGIGVAAGKALIDSFNDGLQVEVRQDRLQALTGLNEGAALRLGRAAGEAYANNFGESIESNMDATRLALQFRILDPKSTTRDAQLVVQGLAGIADVLEEDVRPVAQSVTQLLSTGMAKNAQEAFDIIAAGARNGMNRNEDLLDTLTEYPALFKQLGLSGEEALGLMNQSMRAGARNSDLAADALKEFQLRASEDLPNATRGFDLLGMSVEDSMARVAAGGQSARDVLSETLTRLSDMPPSVERTAAAFALFGSQGEDLAESLFAMDLSTAVDQLDGVTGSAQRMFDTLASNDASKVEQAQRNIEVAADGIKGALAAAFSEPLGDFADWVSQNRGPVLQFFSDLVNGAIDFAITANTGFSEFVSGPLAGMVKGLSSVIGFFDHDAGKELEAFADEMRGFGDSTDFVNDKLESMRGKFNGFADEQIALGHLNDAAMRTADAVSQVGLAQDGTRTSGDALRKQVVDAAAAYEIEIAKAREAEESQQNLKDRYNSTRQALLDQMVAMGLTQNEAQSLIDTVLKTPDEMSTKYRSNAESEKQKADNLARRIVTLPDGSIAIQTNTSSAQQKVDSFILRNNNREIRVKVIANGAGIKMGSYTVTPGMHDGGIVEMMAAGGIPGARPMPNIAQMVSPNTFRVVGDRSDVDEAYIPLDGSARSMAILFEAIRRMPGLRQMADGAVVGPDAGVPGLAAPAPLIGSLTLQSSGNVRDDMAEVTFWLRALERGGRGR